MKIENNIASSELIHENAYTNNTFSLPETERAIRCTLENSYHYLMNLQKSYVYVKRYNKNEQDLHFDLDGRASMSLDFDFIDASKRKVYKDSEYYNQYIGVKELAKNPEIFFYIPVILIDGKSITSYKIKSALDGHTDLMFTHIDMPQAFVNGYHDIIIMFFKNTYLHQFTTNQYIVQRHEWKLPQRLTGIKKELGHGTVFFMMRDTSEIEGTDFFVANIDDENNLILNEDNDLIYDFLVNHKNVEFTLYSPDGICELPGIKTIKRRVDNGRMSCTFVIQEDEWQPYKMPIPTNNVLIFKCHKVTGKLVYQNNKEVILHYPNIYEVMSDDVEEDLYDYKIYYLYKKAEEFLHYRDDFKYIHRYFARKLGTDYEGAVNQLLYDRIDDRVLQDYFFTTLDYDDTRYYYDHGDFFTTLRPYDFDYKIEKMREFIVKDPYAFIPYAKRVGMPYQSYHLDVKTIDLKKRERMDTTQEAVVKSDYFYFGEPYYVFIFGNETNEHLDLRFFVDGLFCEATFQLHVNDMEYIYIPKSRIKENSRITIERFESYSFQQKIVFKNTNTPVVLKFDRKEFIKPTLYDLFVTDPNWKHLDRSKFRIYALVDTAEYDVSDILGITEDDLELLINDDVIYEDPDTGEIYILLEDSYTDEEDDDSIDISVELGPHDQQLISYSERRLPVKYMVLNKLKIFCTEPSYLNQDLRFVVTKVPFIAHKCMENRGLPKIQLFSGNVPWKKAKSYIRVFLNGRLQPMEFDIVSGTGIQTFFVPRCYLSAGDVIVIDVTPFSYEMEYYEEKIPSNFRIDFNGALTKPFDHSYYDVYLNGRKLDDHNVKLITPEVIQFFNVTSRKNLRIYHRDRDYEFYRFGTVLRVPLDDLLGSDDISEEDKEDIIYDIIYDEIPEEDVEPGKDDEWNNETIEPIPESIFHKYRFYVDIILPAGVPKPNEFFINKDLIESAYPGVYETYSNKKNRVVMRPNVCWEEASLVLMLGKDSADKTPYDPSMDNALEVIEEVVGNTDDLEHLGDGTIIGTIYDLVVRSGGLKFRVDPVSGILSAETDSEIAEESDYINSVLGDLDDLEHLGGDSTVIGAIMYMADRMGRLKLRVDDSGVLSATKEVN